MVIWFRPPVTGQVQYWFHVMNVSDITSLDNCEDSSRQVPPLWSINDPHVGRVEHTSTNLLTLDGRSETGNLGIIPGFNPKCSFNEATRGGALLSCTGSDGTQFNIPCDVPGSGPAPSAISAWTC